MYKSRMRQKVQILTIRPETAHSLSAVGGELTLGCGVGGVCKGGSCNVANPEVSNHGPPRPGQAAACPFLLLVAL